MSNIVISRIVAAARNSAVAAIIGLAAVSGAAGASVAFAGPAVATPAHATDPTSTGMYGNPTAAAKFWQQQHLDDCGLMSVADVVGELTGHLPTEQEIIALAEKTPSKTHPGSIYIEPADSNDPNSGQGTMMSDLEVLLAHYGVHGVTTDEKHADESGMDTGMQAVKKYLADGHRVIAYVNAETIWGTSDGQTTDADHFLVVTGVDTKNGMVHLNDSGTKDGRDEQVPLATFMKAWRAGDEAIVVTEETGK